MPMVYLEDHQEVIRMVPSADLRIQKDRDHQEVKLQDLPELRDQDLQIQKVQDPQEVRRPDLRDLPEQNLQDLHQLKDPADQQGNLTLLLHRTIHHQEAEVQVVAMAAAAVAVPADQAEAADNLSEIHK